MARLASASRSRSRSVSSKGSVSCRAKKGGVDEEDVERRQGGVERSRTDCSLENDEKEEGRRGRSLTPEYKRKAAKERSPESCESADDEKSQSPKKSRRRRSRRSVSKSRGRSSSSGSRSRSRSRSNSSVRRRSRKHRRRSESSRSRSESSSVSVSRRRRRRRVRSYSRSRSDSVRRPGGSSWPAAWGKGGGKGYGKGKGGARDAQGYQEKPGKRYTGKVTRFTFGYGFISCDDYPREIFVHQENINKKSGDRAFKVGERVTFECETLYDGRFNAVDARPVNVERRGRYRSCSSSRSRSMSRSRSRGRRYSRSRSARRFDTGRNEARTAVAVDITKDCRGIMTRFDGHKGFGFIECSEFPSVIFCHVSEIERGRDDRKIDAGDKVTLDVETLHDGRYNAKHVCLY